MTKTFKYPDAKAVLVCGDIHGAFANIVSKLCVQYACTDTLLIVAGDCGFGFEKPEFYKTVYNRVAGRLRKANNWVVFLRGNHDDPSYFSEEKVSFKRWRCVPDYSVIQACGHNLLCIGGGVSIDRKMRQERNARFREMGRQTACWWPDEAPVYDESALDALTAPVDAVVSHTAPSFFPLDSLQGLTGWAAEDPTLLEDVAAERHTMDRIFFWLRDNKHPVTHWYYGHFHQTWNGEREGVRFSMLDIEEFKEIPAVASEKPAFNPEETISLRSRSGEGTFLRLVGGNEYELCGDLDPLSVHYNADGSIFAVDPPGGPFLHLGGTVDGKTIKGIRCEGEHYYLRLE